MNEEIVPHCYEGKLKYCELESTVLHQYKREFFAWKLLVKREKILERTCEKIPNLNDERYIMLTTGSWDLMKKVVPDFCQCEIWRPQDGSVPYFL